MKEAFSRTRLLLGDDAMNRLAASRVAVFGVGGVGGYAVEALARSGIGALDLIDSDRVSPSNINRQILAAESTVGRRKVEVAAARIADINPACRVRTYPIFYLPETASEFDFSVFDYVVDAIDTVTGKLQLVAAARAAGTPVISSMGAGNKLDPTAFRVDDISRTTVCPLARIMRKELRKRGIEHLKVVYSPEKPLRPLAPGTPDILGCPDCAEHESSGCPAETEQPQRGRRDIPGSIAFVPSVAGLIIASEVVKDLIAL